MIPLTSNEIHLWLTSYNEIDDEQLCVAYRSLLDDEEKKQERRFHFSKDRLRYLVTRALVRVTLSHYAPLAPESWLFSANQYGRPEIANPELISMRLSFNISHTHGLIVLAVTRCRALGVDVENVCAPELSMDIADQFFSSEEVAALVRLPRELQQYRFFEYWTFKESYIKARSMGLSIPLNRFSFDLTSDHAVDLKIDPELGDKKERWMFWQFRPTPEYCVAICAERIDCYRPHVVVKKVIPTVAEEIVGPTFLRMSE